MDELIEVKKCCELSGKLKAIYEALNIKKQPFTKKSVVHKLKIKNQQCVIKKGSLG